MPMKDSDIEIFVAGAAVRTTAEITGVNRNTVRVFFQRLRKLIASKLPCYELSGGWIVFFPQPCIVLSSRAIVEAGRVRGHRFVVPLCVLLASVQAGVGKSKKLKKRHIMKPDETPK